MRFGRTTMKNRTPGSEVRVQGLVAPGYTVCLPHTPNPPPTPAPCLFAPPLFKLWQHFCLKRHFFPLCWHKHSRNCTVNFSGKVVQLKNTSNCGRGWIFQLNSILMWFSVLKVCLCQCGEQSSGSKEHKELWKRVGLFIGLCFQSIQDAAL